MTTSGPDQKALLRGQRALEMAEKYAAGATLAEIGDYYGLTRERVRQLMTQELGVTRKDGGKHKRRTEKAAVVAKQRETKFLHRYGMTEQEFRAAVLRVDRMGRDPMTRFRTQKGNAGARGIAWRLTFADWWLVWTESGKWLQRGRGDQGYVMARHGDRGAYEIGNVKIISTNENHSEYIRRYWKQVRDGKRPAPKNAAREAGSKFAGIKVGETVRLPITQRRPIYAANAAYNYARGRGWKFSASTKGGVLTVTRVA